MRLYGIMLVADNFIGLLKN